MVGNLDKMVRIPKTGVLNLDYLKAQLIENIEANSIEIQTYSSIPEKKGIFSLHTSSVRGDKNEE
jgi:hypothetical protein